MFSIGMAAMIIGVCTKTLRRWEKRGLITPKRTLGGHRRYTIADLMQVGYHNEETKTGDQIPPKKLTLLYSRVSNHKQKKRGDLERQQQYLEQYCKQEHLCALFNVAIIALKTSLGKSVQHELVDDMMSLIACFSGKLYGLRSQQARGKTKA
ncbi:MAG: IS607 family transposase [Promethearchaeota archaeon]